MFKSKKLFISVFLLFFNFIYTQNPDNQASADKAEASDSKALVTENEVQNSDKEILSQEDLESILEELDNFDFKNPDSGFADLFKNPAEMAEKLPSEIKDKVIKAWEISGKVSATVMGASFLQGPMDPVFDLINELKEKIKEEELEKIIIKIENLFKSQKFLSAIQYALFDDQLKKELNLNLNILENQMEDLSKDDFIYDRLLILKNIILAFKTDKIDLYFESIEKYNAFQRINASILFNEAIKDLDKYLNSNNINKEQREAVLFFKEEIFEGLKPVIDSIDDNGNVDLLRLKLIPLGDAGQYLLKILDAANKTSKISPAMLLSYGFYKKFLSYYLMDNSYTLKLFLGDTAISSLILPFYILKKISDVNKMRGKCSNDQILMALSQAISEISSFYSDPNYLVKRSNWPMRSVYRIVSALAYYNIWYRNHGNHDNHVNRFYENENPYYRYWPKEFKHLKNSIWFSLKDGSLSLAYLLERGIYSKVNKNILDKIENNSLGLIKPDLIRFGINTAMPLLTYKYFPKNIANLDRESVFAMEKPRFFNREGRTYNYFIKPLSFAYGYKAGLDSIYYVGNRNFDSISDSQYVEGRILGYLSVTLGAYFGKKASLRFKNQFGYLLGKIIFKSLQKLNIIDFDEEVKKIKGEEENLTDISSEEKLFLFLKEILKANIPALFISEELGPQVDQLRSIFFSILLEYKVFTQLELAKFEKEVLQGNISEKRLDEFSQKILDALKGVFAQKIGGFIGGFSSWLVTDMLVKKHSADGPIYRKVLNQFS
ncbi:hypothetical protein GF385_04235 [Candidatus Dependentiae bacterium]|nr:hypothetical protein [Candidatus Dependentiae bacterium]